VRPRPGLSPSRRTRKDAAAHVSLSSIHNVKEQTAEVFTPTRFQASNFADLKAAQCKCTGGYPCETTETQSARTGRPRPCVPGVICAEAPWCQATMIKKFCRNARTRIARLETSSNCQAKARSSPVVRCRFAPPRALSAHPVCAPLPTAPPRLNDRETDARYAEQGLNAAPLAGARPDRATAKRQD
jgi:hypothetical protein